MPIERAATAFERPPDGPGAVVTFGAEEITDNFIPTHDANLAEYMDENDLRVLASELIRDFDADKNSRSEWEKSYVKGLDLLGLNFEDRTTPWNGACGVFHPMLAEAVVRFQAQTIQEIFPASGPVKTSIVGDRDSERVRQAQRVEGYLNYLATEEMIEYRSETEKLLFSLPLAGSAFRKLYFDPNLERPCSMFVPAEDFVVSYGASDLSTCERATHVMKYTANRVRKLQVSGFYRDIELPQPQPDIGAIQRKYDKLTGGRESAEVDSRHELLEMQVELDLPGYEDRLDGALTGVALPYVVTVEKSSRTVLSIRRNWLEDDPRKLKRDHVVHYQYLPGLGFYGFGLVHMIGGLAKSATSLLRQLVDAGTLSNLPGGLKTRGLRIKGDDSPILPGEFRDVDVPSGAIRDNIQFLPYKEPSAVLYQLLADIVGEGRRFASAADVKASDMNNEAPVGTTLAILEREMKVLSAVQARVHAAMGKELRLLAQLVKYYGPQDYPYDVGGEFTISADFDDRVDIIPVSDPNAGTMAQRIMQYQAALQLASTAPQMYNMPLLHRQMLDVLGIQDTGKMVPLDEDLRPTDPVTENMALLTGTPVKAFLYQDHEAHIQTHLSAAQHPQILQLMQQNPQAKTVIAMMTAHVSDHLAMAYRQQIEKELGVQLPDPEQPLPEDIELRLSRLVAPAAEQLTGKAKQQQQAEENARLQEDPIIQMEKEKLQLERDKLEKKSATEAARIMADMEKAEDKLKMEWRKLEQTGQVETARAALKAVDINTRAEAEDNRITSKEQMEGYRMGLEFARRIIGTPDG